MIDFGSNAVPLIWSAAYLSSTLWRIVASFQKFGDPESAWSTTGSFHWMPPAGFWCSWASPIACPNSWAAVPPSSNPRFIVAWFAGMLRQSVPTYDHAPSSGSNVMRMSAASASSKTNLRFATCSHHPACVRALAFWVAVPDIRRTRSVEPFIQLLPIGEIARAGPPARAWSAGIASGLSVGPDRSRCSVLAPCETPPVFLAKRPFPRANPFPLLLGRAPPSRLRRPPSSPSAGAPPSAGASPTGRPAGGETPDAGARGPRGAHSHSRPVSARADPPPICDSFLRILDTNLGPCQLIAPQRGQHPARQPANPGHPRGARPCPDP